MAALPGLNLIFHTIRPGGGMERHVLDLIRSASAQGLPSRVITRRLEWPGEPPAKVEFIVLRDRTPLARLNTQWFETHSFAHVRADWPSIAVSRVPGPELCIVGGSHMGHLLGSKRRPGHWFDRTTIARERAMYERARTIVCHSAFVATEVRELYHIAAEKVVTLYPPVDAEVFSPAARAGRETLRRSLGIAPDELLLLFPSNDHARKGGDLIIQALDGADRRIRLAVAGKAPLAAPRVLNLGYRNDMPSLYAAADAVILASQYEAFGLVGPEAVLCGTPVLFANNVGAAEVLSEEACLRFERDVPALRAALKLALERFDAGTLALGEDPGRYIRYPYTLRQHFDALFALLAASWHT
jgi:glycosyltransferase involved in cell wall biosynthesis